MPVKRKYEHPVWVKCSGTVEQFLSTLQVQLLKFKPHKIYQHMQNPEVKKLSIQANNLLHNLCCVAYWDYSENWKKHPGTSGIPLQYREMPEASLINGVIYTSGTPAEPDQTPVIYRDLMHYISDDPKHDTCLFPRSMLDFAKWQLERQPGLKVLILCTDTSKKEFKSVPVLQRLWKNISTGQ